MASNWTDDELRLKLIELGEDVGPINSTTRYLYVKRYNNIVQEKKKQSAGRKNASHNASRNVSRSTTKTRSQTLNEFSSDENASENENEYTRAAKTRIADNSAKLKHKTHTNANIPKPSSENNSNINQDFTRKPSRSSVNQQSTYNYNRALEMSESHFSHSTPKSSYFTNVFNRQSYSKNSDNSEFKNGASFVTKRSPRESKPYPEFHLKDTSRNSHLISRLLPICVALFFVAIGVMYINSLQVRPPHSSFNLSIPVCDDAASLIANKAALPDYSCIDKDYVNDTLEFSHELYSILSNAAGNYHCGSRKEVWMEEVEVKKELESIYSHMNSLQFFRNFMYSLLLIRDNPSLKIKFHYAPMSKGRLYDIEKMEALEPYKTLWCRCKLAFNSALSQLLLVLSILVIIAILYFIVKYKIRQWDEQKKTIYLFVDQIIDSLSEQYHKTLTDKSEKPYLAVSHLRDMLIPPAHRKSYMFHWQKAVDLIESEESRVKVEYKDISGEKFKVWRWLQNSSGPKNEGKIWQGQAFGSNSPGLNMLAFCPTAFLKVRNMFESQIEAGTEWTNAVKDAILEKCEGNHGIVHIYIDSASLDGCVYVKCLDKESAHKAYTALHGWWYDGKLVTVKFLRPERYHSKFPESAHSSLPLKPSNNLRRSISPSFSSSILESS